MVNKPKQNASVAKKENFDGLAGNQEVYIGLSTGGVEGDACPPEFDMGGTYGKMSPPEFQEIQLKKYNVNISDAAITLPLEQHQVWELVALQTNQISSR